jgi:hypothetical protein
VLLSISAKIWVPVIPAFNTVNFVQQFIFICPPLPKHLHWLSSPFVCSLLFSDK